MLRTIFLLFTITAISAHAQITPPSGGGSGVQSLTTTGTSGPSTLSGTVLNVPTYSVGGYTGCTTDGANGINCTGQVAAGNAASPIQFQNNYELVSTLTAIAKLQPTSGFSPAQLRIRLEGDSTTGMHNPAIACELLRRYGSAGFTGLGSAGYGAFAPCGGALAYSTTGTVTVPTTDFALSPEGQYWNLAPGACLTVTSSGGYGQANTLAFMYIQEPGAGTLEMLSNLNGAGWVSQGTVSTAGTTSGQVFQKAMTEGYYQMRGCATVANVKIYSNAMIDTAKNGVIIEGYGKAGLNLPDYTSTPAVMTANWDAFENPDLVMFKMDANGNLGYPTCNYSNYNGSIINQFSYFWNLWSARWLTGAPNRDVVVDGSYASEDTDCILVQNLVQRQWGYTNHKKYFDGYYPGGTIANQVALGWLVPGDHAHQTYLGQIALSEILMRELGLNGLWTGAVSNDVANTNLYSKNRYLSASGGFITSSNPALETVIPINSSQDIGYTFSRAATFTATASTVPSFVFNNNSGSTNVNVRFQGTGVDQLTIGTGGNLTSQATAAWRLTGPTGQYLQMETSGQFTLNGGQLYEQTHNIITAFSLVSQVATGTAPITVTSTTPVANLTLQKHSLMNTCATTTTCANTAQLNSRTVHGNVTLSGGSAVVASMTAWTATTSYDCTGTDRTGANAVAIANTSTTSITITGTGTDVISYICVGN